MSNWEKALCSSKSPIFIQKDETVGLPTNDPWASQLFTSQNSTFIKCLQNRYILQKWMIIHEESPTWVFKNLFHAKASEAIPSNAQGSKKWMFISNFASWFFMASILAALKWSWSSNRCTLMAEWSTSSLKIWSSRALMCCIFASSSWYLFYKISTNELWSGKTSSLFSASTWHQLYVIRSLLKNSVHAPLVFLIAFLKSSAVYIANSTKS